MMAADAHHRRLEFADRIDAIQIDAAEVVLVAAAVGKQNSEIPCIRRFKNQGVRSSTIIDDSPAEQRENAFRSSRVGDELAELDERRKFQTSEPDSLVL